VLEDEEVKLLRPLKT